MIEISAAPLFAGLSPLELARLVRQLDEVSFPAGCVLFRQGEPGDCMYVVRSGIAEARAGSGGESDYPLSVFEPGDSFGEMALLTDEPRSTTIVALTDLHLWALSKGRFLAMVQESPGLAIAVARLLSRRLQATNQAVSSMHGAFDVAAEQAYQQLDPELQGLLRLTAPLNPVTADVVARALDRPDAEQVLARLADRLPFIATEAGGLYRYHRLFQELLNDKLAAELGEQGRRAWLQHLAASAQAVGKVEQALTLLVEAGDSDAAQNVAVSHGRSLLENDQLEQLGELLASMPSSLAQSHGKLAGLRAELLARRGNVLEAIGVLEEAERQEDQEEAADDEVSRAARYRRLAELNFELGRSREGVRWLRHAGEGEADGQEGIGDLEQLVPLSKGPASGASSRAFRAIASLTGLRKVSSTAGVLGGRGGSRPLGVGLSAALLLWFFLSSPPAGLSREGYLALGILIGAMPLLIFSVLADHLVTLLMAASWALLGLVPARVALSGFATPGWFLVLSVLALGVALARSGLLYRIVLWLLAHAPSNHASLTLVLTAAGLAFSPAMPNATARTALAAPLVLEISDAIGYAPRSRGSAAIGMAVLLGFGQMCTLFLTGSSSGLLVHSLLPPDSRERFSWLGWLVAALPLHLVIFLVTYAAIVLLLRPETTARPAVEKLQAQRQILGAPTRAERITGITFVLLVLAFVAAPLMGIEAAWPAVLAMVVLVATNVLDQQGFKSGINWAFLIFFGVMLSLGEVFGTLKVDAWVAGAAASPLTPLAGNPALFLLAVGLAGYLLNLLVRWQAACVLMTLVLVPAVLPLGIEPWVVGITALVTTNMWFLPYQSTIYQALYYGADEQAFTHTQVRPIALVYGSACLLGLVASVPVWQRMGLLP